MIAELLDRCEVPVVSTSAGDVPESSITMLGSTAW